MTGIRKRASAVAVAATVAGAAIALLATSSAQATPTRSGRTETQPQVTVGHSAKNDTSPKLRNIKPIPVKPQAAHQAVPNPPIVHPHTNRTLPNTHVQTKLAAPHMPGTTFNFDGIPYPGVNCA